MSRCKECGLEPDRSGMAFGDSAHRRRPDALDEEHLTLGAQNLSVDVTRRRRVEMNRIRAATGMTLTEQVCRALDLWLPGQRSR